jgi:hypothetical protein
MVRGWAVCGAPEETARELLGEAASPSSLHGTSDGWKVEDPVSPEQPVGPMRSLLTFESDEPLHVLIVPGSQGQPPPPTEAGHEVISLSIERGRSLILDARCWYNVKAGPGLSVRLWFHRPLASHA